MPRALKVFRTAIGFHDAYVAATSRKAALEAWGSATDLFAVGLAEQVTDEALIREPLAHPGTVLKRIRGTPADHLEAAKPLQPVKHRAGEDDVEKPASSPPPVRKPNPKPRPSRAEIEAAEAAMKQLLARQRSETDDLDRREAELRREREKLRAAHEKERQKADDAVRLARQSHEDAIQRWLAEQEREGGQ